MNTDHEPTTRDTAGGDRPALADYDQLPLGDLRHRIRALDEEALSGLIDHEREHGDRTPVLEVLRSRMAELENGAEPSPGDPNRSPGVDHTAGDSPVQPGTAAEPNTPLRNGLAEQTPARGRP
ncbi:hypothetical protein [Actinophytocola algeriensis]|uniref:DUF8129 domain-containing protein n=1 Tax=Actinophytocola algeriensis TaxID=1768010 RepID=A0A7W7VIJ3_9PSEU|nr:hypothetical protein [Actinophytocola algeriensis]MBB4911503.1 hypothetical protein [Actinophytocola algeriensis]MBE1473509.1 hypothetical protein [Actinophytocola algeriensis]